MIAAVILGVQLLDAPARGQDAAWEGSINAGRNALQQKKFSEAERHFEAALEAAERFPSGDARLGRSYNNLAAVYYAQEDYERAEPLMRRALAQLREALGPDNTDVAQTMKNLAALYYLQGNRSEAEALLKQSLEILEKAHGPNHAFVATVLSNLAGLYQAEGRYQDAEPLLTRSLAIWESLLGSDHPDVVRSRSLLAKVRQGRGGGAEETAEASPRALTPSQANAEAETAESDAVEEVERAQTALEQLAETSRRQADRARAAAEGVPIPALSSIGNAVDAAVSPADAEQPNASAAVPGQEGDQSTGEIATAALDPLDAAAKEAAAANAILNEATTASDVSFAIYLSTLWSIDEARRYWQAMQTAMPDVLRNKQMQIEEVAGEGGAEPFYRVLTTPFASDPDAKAACEQIKAKLRTHDCDVVVRDTAAEG